MAGDFWLIITWWGTLFLVGAMAFPLTRKLFSGWYDQGYFFTKAVGLATVSWLVYVLGTFHFLSFSQVSIVLSMAAVFLLGMFFHVKFRKILGIPQRKHMLLIIFEEAFFFAALLFWSWIKGHEPSIHGLEKFMDYGFMKSILESKFFPPADMWYAGKSINYYYFGHLVTAVLTKLSNQDLSYTFNLMLATIFAFTLTMSFSIGYQLLVGVTGIGRIRNIIGALLTAFLVTMAGNMQTIYALTKGYTGDAVKPFWELLWPVQNFWQSLPIGLTTYWYANATRFIPFTIHEFPSYSFVVSDVHGHVLSLPFVLLAIGLLIAMFGLADSRRNFQFSIFNFQILFYGFLVGVLLMTNALDGPIYFGLFAVIALTRGRGIFHGSAEWWQQRLIEFAVILVVGILVSLPFLFHFESFVSGLAVNCPPIALQNSRFGPLMFEGAEKCQHSPIWMMALLWGFFWYCGLWFIFRKKVYIDRNDEVNERVLKVFFFFSLALIIFPEFFYFKDIYPMHFRSNTMFKLGYQAFILFSIVSGYTIATSITWHVRKHAFKIVKILFFIFLVPQLFLVSIYPIFSVRSYFNSLVEYQGLWGLNWFARDYPGDYAGLLWLNSQPHVDSRFTLLEADGDSYTDYARFSTFTGIPTIIGWPVHEWLWRGSYDVVAPRRDVVRLIYETKDPKIAREFLARFDVRYIIIGSLERQKYPELIEEKFTALGRAVFHQGNTTIYQVL